VTPRAPVPTLVWTALLPALVAGAVGLEVVRDRWYGAAPSGESVLYVRSPAAVKRAALSYAAVLGDVYWIRTLQYYGGTRLSKDKQKDYALLAPLLDITTTLDPRFRIAYRFGAIFLAEPMPGGAGRPDLAIALLEKGAKAQPHYWAYLQDIGFVHYWWIGDFHEAARWFQKASEIPGAPLWLRSLAAVTLTQGGDRRGSRILWQSLLSTAEDEWLRRNASLRLAQLDALDEIDRLQGAVRDFASRFGTFPGWEALRGVGVIRSVPHLDPAGVPYVLDGLTGIVTVSPASPLHPLPTGERIQFAPR